MKLSKTEYKAIYHGVKTFIIIPIHEGSHRIGDPIQFENEDDSKEKFVAVVEWKEQTHPTVQSFVYGLKVIIRQGVI